jgi:hypothetical protein
MSNKFLTKLIQKLNDKIVNLESVDEFRVPLFVRTVNISAVVDITFTELARVQHGDNCITVP